MRNESLKTHCIPTMHKDYWFEEEIKQKTNSWSYDSLLWRVQVMVSLSSELQFRHTKNEVTL